jgi:hypothetical protein
MAGKSNVPAETAAGAPVKPTPFALMVRAMANDATASEGEFSGDDLNAILAAESEEEMWDADERPPLNFQHLAGCEIAIIDFTVKYSRGGNDSIKTPFTYDGKKMYILATCTRLSDAGEKSVLRLPPVGEIFQANTSARFVVAKIWKAMIMGLIDYRAGKSLECVVQVTDLGDGTGVLKLRPIPKRVTQSTTV